MSEIVQPRDENGVSLDHLRAAFPKAVEADWDRDANIKKLKSFPDHHQQLSLTDGELIEAGLYHHYSDFLEDKDLPPRVRWAFTGGMLQGMKLYKEALKVAGREARGEPEGFEGVDLTDPQTATTMKKLLLGEMTTAEAGPGFYRSAEGTLQISLTAESFEALQNLGRGPGADPK